MKLIHETQINGWDETGEQLYIYALDSDEEYYELQELIEEHKHSELLEMFGLYEHSGWCVYPGEKYWTYDFYLSGKHLIIEEHIGLNI